MEFSSNPLYPPDEVPRHRFVCTSVWSACLSSKLVLSSSSSFFLLLFLFTNYDLSLSLCPYYRDRYNTLKEKRSRLVERYRGSPVLIEAAVSSFGQISISISIICSILIRDWKRRGSMEFFQLQFAQLVDYFSKFGLSNSSSSFRSRYLSTKMERMLLLQLLNFSKIIDNDWFHDNRSNIFRVSCEMCYFSRILFIFFFLNHIFYPLLEYFLTNSFTFFSRNSHILRIDEIKKKK